MFAGRKMVSMKVVYILSLSKGRCKFVASWFGFDLIVSLFSLLLCREEYDFEKDKGADFHKQRCEFLFINIVSVQMVLYHRI